MKRFLATLLLLASLPIFAQTGGPDVTVDYVADAVARRARTNEVLQIKNYSATASWPAPRTFIAQPITVITNAHDGVHYITNKNVGLIYTSNDRFAMEQDAAWWGAVGNAVIDDTVALNAASAYTARYIDESSYTTLKGPGRGFLRIRPTTAGYIITNTVYLQSSTYAEGAAIIYRGQKTNSLALAVGPADYKNMNINNHTFNLPDVWGYGDGFNAAGSMGVSIRSVGRSTVRLGYVHRFETGIQLLGDTAGWVFGINFDRGMTDACRYSLTLLATNGGFVNENTFNGLVLNNENINYAPGFDTGYEMIKIDGTDGSINGNTWQGGGFEGFPGQRVIHILNASANIFYGQRWENHVMDYPSVNGSKLYMEVESTVTGRGLNNRIMWPSQGVNGMAGVMVKETGASAIGNSGASSDWQEFRSSDVGDYHGPIVLTSSSLTSQGLGHLTVYPYMAWPDTHYSLYTNWVVMLTGNSMQFKGATDVATKLYLSTDGSLIQSAGTAYLPQWKQQDGISYYYNTSSQVTMQVNRDGYIDWMNPAEGTLFSRLQTYRGSTFGGMRLTGAATNQLNGFTFEQTLANVTNNQAPYAFPGLDLVGYTAGVASNYVYSSYGIYGPLHPHGYIQDRVGFYINANHPSALGSDGFGIAMPQSWMDFTVTLGLTTNPSLQVDQSTTAGDTRLLTWIASSNGPVRLKHDDTAKLFYTGASLNQNIAGIAAAGGGGAGKVLSYVNATTFAWSNAPSSFSFSDLTNAVRPGANVTFNYTSTNFTIDALGGSGATNGTALSVDGGAALSVANLADSAKVNHSASGSNITSLIVADSIDTNDIAAATESYFLNLAVHTGILAVANGGTGITNVTAAGQALMSAVDAAAQRALLSVTNYQAGIGVQLTGTNFSHNVAAGTNIVLTTNGNQLVINTPGGGSGAAVLVNGTNVSNPNFRRFFGISDSTNVDLLLAAGTNVTFTTNSGTLTINATAGTGVSTNIPVVKTLLVSGSVVTNSTSNTSETNQIATLAMGSTNVAANTASAGTTYRLRAFGRLTAASTDYEGTFRFKVGGVTASVAFSEPHSYQPVNVGWQLEANVTVLATGASAAVQVYGNLIWQGDAENQDTLGAILRDVSGSGTFNTTAGTTLEFTYQNDTINPLTLVTAGVTIEQLGQDITLTGGSSGGGTTNLVSTSTNGLAPQITASNAVFMSSSTGVPEWQPNRVTKTIATFRATQYEPPISSYATPGTRNGISVLLYDPTVFTSGRFRWMVPEGYNLTNVTVVLKWTTSATSGDGTWVVKNAKLTGDIDSLSFGASVTNTVTTSATAGTIMTSTLTGVTVSSPSAGDWIYTDVARIDDSINGNNLELHTVEVRAE